MCHNGFRDAVNVGLGPRLQLNFLQLRIVYPCLRESAREERVAAVAPNPPRELSIKLFVRSSGGTSSISALSLRLATADQAARDSSREGLLRRGPAFNWVRRVHER